MKEPTPINSVKISRAEKRRRIRRRRIIRLTTVIVVAVFLIAAIVWGVIEIRKASKGESASFFGVKAIEVEFVDGEGTVRYPKEDIIRASGLFVNQSLLAVNKVQASTAVLQQFPYLDYVEVKNTSFSTVCIRVAEAEVLAALQTEQDWLIVGRNNHVLERVTTEALPADLLHIVGATPVETSLGGDAMDERSLRICTTVFDAVEACELTGVTTLDVTEKTDLRLWWKDQVEILLGNESNLTAQVTAFKKMLPTLVEKNGDSVAGQFDMTSYADDKSDNDRAVYTPADSLKKTEKNDENKGDNTTGTTGAGDTAATSTTAA